MKNPGDQLWSPARSTGQGESAQREGPLKVLFVGALIQRKGIGYLLEAIEMLGAKVESTLIGMRFAANARVDAACERWRWIETISHDEVMKEMMQSDVLVLPSLSEAFGACGDRGSRLRTSGDYYSERGSG